MIGSRYVVKVDISCSGLVFESYTIGLFLLILQLGLCLQTDEYDHGRQLENFECSVEVLANIDLGSNVQVLSCYCQNHSSYSGLYDLLVLLILINFQVSPSLFRQSARLPRQLREPLMQEMESYILEVLADYKFEKKPLSDVFFICALLCNLMYGLYVTRFVLSS